MKAVIRSAAWALVALAIVWAVPAGAAVKVPPTIGQLHETTWASKATGTGYYLMGGGKEKIGGVNPMYIAQVDTTIIEIHFNDPDSTVVRARYYSDSGVAVFGDLNDDALSTVTICGYLVFSGTPGKLKLTGEAIDYDTVSDGEASVMKITGKQVISN